MVCSQVDQGSMSSARSTRRTGRPPSPPASDDDMPVKLQDDDFALPSPAPTAPPSLPVSPPSSPQATRLKESKTRRSRRIKGERAQEAEAGSVPSSSQQRAAQNGVASSSKAQLAFPSIVSDDEDWSPLAGGAPGDSSDWHPRSSGGAASRRSWSQTTTTTRKTEQHTYRYSLPSFDYLYDEHDLSPPPLPRSTRRAPSPLPRFSSTPSHSRSGDTNGNNSPKRGTSPRHSFYGSSKPSRTRSPSAASASRKRTTSPASRGYRSSLPSRRATSMYSALDGSPL